jgi:hypothetical protein
MNPNQFWSELLAMWIGGVLLLLPVAALAARLGLRPVLESVARVRAAGQPPRELEQRVRMLERRLAALQPGAGEREYELQQQL